MPSFITAAVLRWVIGGLSLLAIVGAIYGKGRYDGRTTYKAKIEREIANAVRDGKHAKADALREFDAAPDSVPDDGFRRP